MSTTNAQMQQRWQAVMQNNYGTPPIALSHGRGVRVWDVEGVEYLDFIAGIATSSLGHAHPALLAAIADQAARVVHTSNLVMHEPGIRLAERLTELAGGGKVFFSNDGAEANECALKLARRHGWLTDPAGGKLTVVAAVGGFHGRTMGSLSITGNPAKREPFLPLPEGVRFVPYGDAEALRAAMDDTVSALFLEPTLGEGGVVPPPPGYLTLARELCDASNALFVLDEVQSGIGRTGTWFQWQHEGARPDILTLAKGLGGGMPIGACIAFGDAASLYQPGDHGSTFGGNPVSAAAAFAVLETIASDGLLESIRSGGERLATGLAAIDSPLIKAVRGSGLWRAVVLTGAHAGAVESAARKHGLLVNAVQPDALRFAPPLIVTEIDIDEAVNRFATAIADVTADMAADASAMSS